MNTLRLCSNWRSFFFSLILICVLVIKSLGCSASQSKLWKHIMFSFQNRSGWCLVNAKEYSWYNSLSPESILLVSSKAFRALPGLRNGSKHARIFALYHTMGPFGSSESNPRLTVPKVKDRLLVHSYIEHKSSQAL